MTDHIKRVDYFLASLYFKHGKYEESAKLLKINIDKKKAVKYENVIIYNRLGQIYKQLGQI